MDKFTKLALLVIATRLVAIGLPFYDAGSDIICWDSNPHQPQHSIFIWLNGESRNVLYANGKVGTVSEGAVQ